MQLIANENVEGIPIEVLASTHLPRREARLIMEKIRHLLPSPLVSNVLSMLGKVPILYLVGYKYVITHPLLYERLYKLIKEEPNSLTFRVLGEKYFETVKESRILLPLLDLSENLPVIPIPEIAGNVGAFMDLYRNLLSIIERGLTEKVRRVVPYEYISVEVSSPRDLYEEAIKCGIGLSRYSELLCFETNLGIIPFYISNKVENSYGILGEKLFNNYEELLSWYLSKQYLKDIENLLAGLYLNNVSINVSRERDLLRAVEFLEELRSKYYPNRSIILRVSSLSGGTTRGGYSGSIFVDYPCLYLVPRKVTLSMIPITVFSPSNVRDILQVDLYAVFPRGRITLPIIVFPREGALNWRDMLTLFMLPIFMLYPRTELGRALTYLRDVLLPKALRNYEGTILNVGVSNASSSSLELFMRDREVSVRLSNVPIIESISELPSRLVSMPLNMYLKCEEATVPIIVFLQGVKSTSRSISNIYLPNDIAGWIREIMEEALSAHLQNPSIITVDISDRNYRIEPINDLNLLLT